MTTGNPIGRRETFEAYRLADVEGTGVFRPYVFQADIAWILECYAAVRMVHGNIGVRDGPVLRDIHGPCDCIDGAVEEAIRLRGIYGVDVDSSMSIEVVVSLLPTAVLSDTATKGSFGRTTHRLVPSDWRRGGMADAEKAFAFVQGTETMENDPRSPPIILTHHILGTVAWTSAVGRRRRGEPGEHPPRESRARRGHPRHRSGDPEVILGDERRMTSDRDAPSAEERCLVVEEQIDRLMAMALEATDRQTRIAMVAFVIDPTPFEDWQASFDRWEAREGPEKAEDSADFFHQERTTRALRAATTIVDLLDCRSPLVANLPKALGHMTETTFASGAKASRTLAARFLSRMPKR